MSLVKDIPPAPTSESKIVIDTNCAINYVININKKFMGEFIRIRGHYQETLRSFFSNCFNRSIPLFYYELIEKEAFRNIQPAVENLLKGFKIPYYIREGIISSTEKKLENFLKKLTKLRENYTPNELKKAKKFFIKHKKSRMVFREKEDIPSDNDLKILISTSKLQNKRVIISEDSDFIDFVKEIYSEYGVIIYPLPSLQQYMIAWGWSKL